jgi:hypothetical protein
MSAFFYLDLHVDEEDCGDGDESATSEDRWFSGTGIVNHSPYDQPYIGGRIQLTLNRITSAPTKIQRPSKDYKFHADSSSALEDDGESNSESTTTTPSRKRSRTAEKYIPLLNRVFSKKDTVGECLVEAYNVGAKVNYRNTEKLQDSIANGDLFSAMWQLSSPQKLAVNVVLPDCHQIKYGMPKLICMYIPPVSIAPGVQSVLQKELERVRQAGPLSRGPELLKSVIARYTLLSLLEQLFACVFTSGAPVSFLSTRLMLFWNSLWIVCGDNDILSEPRTTNRNTKGEELKKLKSVCFPKVKRARSDINENVVFFLMMPSLNGVSTGVSNVEA